MLRYGIQKHDYVELVANLTNSLHPPKITKIMGWISNILDVVGATEYEYGVVASLIKDVTSPRSLRGPYPYALRLNPSTTVRIAKWMQGLRTHNGKRDGMKEFFQRLIPDLELQEYEKDLLYNRVQNARSKKFKNFKWRSEVLRQLRKWEKIDASRLYGWAHYGKQIGEIIPDLERIVEEMNKQSIPNGPSLVNLEKMRKGEQQTFVIPHEPSREALLRELGPELEELKAMSQRKDALTFAKWVCQRHSPNGSTGSPILDSMSVRQALTKALVYYHPDKQAGESMKWQLLSEEITKCLTKYLAFYR